MGATFWALLALDLALPPVRTSYSSGNSDHLPALSDRANKAATTKSATAGTGLLEDGPRFGAAVVASGVAIMFRQTNAVWAAFAFGVSCLHALERDPVVKPSLCGGSANTTSGSEGNSSSRDASSGIFRSTNGTESKRKGNSGTSEGAANSVSYDRNLSSSSNSSSNSMHSFEESIFPGVSSRPGLIAQVWALATGCMTRAPSLIFGNGGRGLLLVPCALFAAFVVFVNDGHLVSDVLVKVERKSEGGLESHYFKYAGCRERLSCTTW